METHLIRRNSQVPGKTNTRLAKGRESGALIGYAGTEARGILLDRD